MSGKVPAAYFREYRARRRAEGRPVRRRAGYVRGRDYSAEYARSRELHPSGALSAPLPLLLPELQRGIRVAFWEDELRLDLAQEYQLARLEGRDPAVAVAAYHARETSWLAHIAPWFEGSVAA